MHRLALACTLSLAVAGCASVPPPSPGLELPARFHHAGSGNAEPSVVAFWRGFDDPLLSTLIEDALHNNHDVRIAAARYDQARALLRESRLDRGPSVTANATTAEQRASVADLPGVPRSARDTRHHQVLAEAAWEVDFFGRMRDRTHEARSRSQAQAADLAAARIAVVGELSQAYFELRGLQARRQVALNHARNQAASLALVGEWEAAGRASRLDTARAQSLVETTRAQVPMLDAGIARSVHRIAVLSGGEPAEVRRLLAPASPAPVLPGHLAVGVPADLLRRRPDVRAAEHRLAAAASRVGIARADLYPRFTLGGLIGSRSMDVSGLFTRESETRVVALGIDWTFLDAGRVRARIAEAQADVEAHLAQYEKVVSLAWEEAETALARYQQAQVEGHHLVLAQAAAREAADLAKLRFELGAAGFIEVLDAERSALATEDLLAQSQARLGGELVAVYRAVAGGWPERIEGGLQ